MSDEEDPRLVQRRSVAQSWEEGMAPLRKCATCGRKTRDYRCPECWAKIKAASTSCDEPSAEYKLGRR